MVQEAGEVQPPFVGEDDDHVSWLPEEDAESDGASETGDVQRDVQQDFQLVQGRGRVAAARGDGREGMRAGGGGKKRAVKRKLDARAASDPGADRRRRPVARGRTRGRAVAKKKANAQKKVSKLLEARLVMGGLDDFMASPVPSGGANSVPRRGNRGSKDATSRARVAAAADLWGEKSRWAEGTSLTIRKRTRVDGTTGGGAARLESDEAARAEEAGYLERLLRSRDRPVGPGGLAKLLREAGDVALFRGDVSDAAYDAVQFAVKRDVEDRLETEDWEVGRVRRWNKRVEEDRARTAVHVVTFPDFDVDSGTTMARHILSMGPAKRTFSEMSTLDEIMRMCRKCALGLASFSREFWFFASLVGDMRGVEGRGGEGRTFAICMKDERTQEVMKLRVPLAFGRAMGGILFFAFEDIDASSSRGSRFEKVPEDSVPFVMPRAAKARAGGEGGEALEWSLEEGDKGREGDAPAVELRSTAPKQWTVFKLPSFREATDGARRSVLTEVTDRVSKLVTSSFSPAETASAAGFRVFDEQSLWKLFSGGKAVAVDPVAAEDAAIATVAGRLGQSCCAITTLCRASLRRDTKAVQAEQAAEDVVSGPGSVVAKAFFGPEGVSCAEARLAAPVAGLSQHVHAVLSSEPAFGASRPDGRFLAFGDAAGASIFSRGARKTPFLFQRLCSRALAAALFAPSRGAGDASILRPRSVASEALVRSMMQVHIESKLRAAGNETHSAHWWRNMGDRAKWYEDARVGRSGTGAGAASGEDEAAEAPVQIEAVRFRLQRAAEALLSCAVLSAGLRTAFVSADVFARLARSAVLPPRPRAVADRPAPASGAAPCAEEALVLGLSSEMAR